MHGVQGKAKLPQLRRQVLDVLSPEEMRRLEDVAEAERDKLIVRLLTDTGVRVGELVKLRVSDLVEHRRDRFLKVEGKGGRDRLVRIAPGVWQRLDRFGRRTRPDAGSDRMWVGLRRGRSGYHEPLTASGVEQLVRVLGQKAGIKRRVHPHLFRHSAITDQLRKGVNPLLVAKNAGHESLSMIASTYSHLDAGDVAAAMAEYLRRRDQGCRMKAITPDTNFWLHAELPFDFAAAAGMADVAVVVPHVVLSELDKHQHEGRRHVKARARERVLALRQLVRGGAKRPFGYEATDEGGVTYWLVPQPPSATGNRRRQDRRHCCPARW